MSAICPVSCETGNFFRMSPHYVITQCKGYTRSISSEKWGALIARFCKIFDFWDFAKHEKLTETKAIFIEWKA